MLHRTLLLLVSLLRLGCSGDSGVSSQELFAIVGTRDFLLSEMEELLFGDTYGIPRAQFTLHNDEHPVKYLYTPRLRKDVEAITCTLHSITFKFPLASTYQEVSKDWRWVNSRSHNTIVLITHSHDCDVGEDDPRDIQPWVIHDAIFNDEYNTVVFEGAEPREWVDVLNNWRFTANSAGLDHPSINNRSIEKRSKRKSINLATDFSGLGISIGGGVMGTAEDQNPIGSLICDPCRTTGHLDFEIDVGPDTTHGVKGNLKFTTREVGAVLQANLQLWNSTATIEETEHEIFGFVPPDTGIRIKGLVDIGPTFTMGYRYALQESPGFMALSAGLNVTVPDSVLEVDISKPNHIKKSGWTIDFEPLTPGMSRNLDLKAKIGPYLSFFMTAEFLDLGGFEAGAIYANPELVIDVTNQKERRSGGRAVDMEIALEHKMYAFANVKAPQGLGALAGKIKAPKYTTLVESTRIDLLSEAITMHHVTEITSPATMPTTQVTSFVPQGVNNVIEQGIRTAASAVSAAIPSITSIASKVESEASTEATSVASAVVSVATAAASTAESDLHKIGDALGKIF